MNFKTLLLRFLLIFTLLQNADVMPKFQFVINQLEIVLAQLT